MSPNIALKSVPAFHASYIDRNDEEPEARDGERSGETPTGVRPD